MLIFFKEFYKKFIEPQANDSDCISACGTKYWFKTAVNGIDLDGIGIDAGGTLAKLTLDGNLFVGCSSGGNAYAVLFTMIIGLFHEYSPYELKYRELHCNEWSFLPSLVDFPHCESETRVDNPIIFLNVLKEIKREMEERQNKFSDVDAKDFNEYRRKCNGVNTGSSATMPAKIIVIDHIENLFRLEQYAKTRGKNGDEIAKLNGTADKILDTMTNDEIKKYKDSILSALAKLMPAGAKYGYHFILTSDDIQYCNSEFIKDHCEIIGLKGTSPWKSKKYLDNDLATSIFGDKTKIAIKDKDKCKLYQVPYILEIGDEDGSFNDIKQKFKYLEKTL